MQSEQGQKNSEIFVKGSEFNEAMQRHHDFYVGLFRQGRIDATSENYILAMEREKEGKVEPLPQE